MHVNSRRTQTVMFITLGLQGHQRGVVVSAVSNQVCQLFLCGGEDESAYLAQGMLEQLQGKLEDRFGRLKSMQSGRTVAGKKWHLCLCRGLHRCSSLLLFSLREISSRIDEAASNLLKVNGIV